jgi:hypothetical protein
MKIVHIQYPYVITDEGTQIPIMEINGHPKIGSELTANENSSATRRYEIAAVTSDSECVSGVCPVR